MTVHSTLKVYDSGLKHLQYVSTCVAEEMIGCITDMRGKEFDINDVFYQGIMNMAFLTGKKYSVGDELFKMVTSLDLKKKKFFSPIGKPSKLDMFPWLRFLGNETYTEILKFCQIFEVLKKEVSEKRNDFTELCDKTMIIEA